MKKICLILGLCLAPGIAKAGFVESAEIGPNLNARAWGGYGPNSGKWYKCTDSIPTTSCKGYVGFKVYYTSISSGSGTQASPYILSGCSLTASGAGCACNSATYLTDTGCKACGNGLAATMPNAVGLHRNTTCSMCAAGYYKDGGACKQCPEYATGKNGESMGGTVPINACYIPKGTTSSDSTGSFEYTENCNYSQS